MEYLGSAWTLWPPTTNRGLHVVDRSRVITAKIISVCLVRQGEDPLLPDFGVSPELFEPLSQYAPQYWVYNLSKEIRKWVAGIDRLSVEMVKFEDYQNQLKTVIQFVPSGEPTPHMLTFGLYAYQGALWGQQIDAFLEDITLDGQPFRKLAS